MPNLRLPVAPLTGGVSTQPADSRLPNQVETSDNTILRLQRGMEKRPGTKFVDALDYLSSDVTTNDAFCHFFSYGSENYVLLIDDNLLDAATPSNDRTGTTFDGDGIRVFNLTSGAKATITVDATNWDASVSAYLRSSSSDLSRDKMRAITYGTTTLLVNTEKVTAVTGTAPHTTLTVNSNLPVPPTDTSFDGSSSWRPSIAHIGSQATPIVLHAFQSDVGYPSGYYEIIAITDTTTGSPTITENDLDGPWYTRLEANADGNELDGSTMPLRLVRTAANAFTLDVISYDKRLSGDTTNNPSPPFIGETIQDLCIFQDRLWFGHETGITSSQAGDLFNFWVDDYTNVTDSDPIALDMPGPQANQVRWLVPVSDSIVVFGSQGGQYEITTRDFFTPSSTNLQVTGARGSEAVTRPSVINQQVAYLEDKEQTSSFWEYFYDFGSDSNLVVEASIPCQGYLPDAPRMLVTATNHNLAFVAPFDSTDIHVYQYFWDATEKLQSAFTRWRFYDYDSTTDAAIWGFYARDNFLWLVIRRLGKVFLERIDIGYPSIAGGLDFNICLDKQISSTGVYDSVTNNTTWTIAASDWTEDDLLSANEDAYRIVLGSGWNDQAGAYLIPDSVTVDGSSNTVLTLSGNWSAAAVTIGIKYTMSSKMSQPMVRDESGQTIQGNFQIRTLEVRHEDTTDYEVVVTPANRDSKTFPFYAGRVGSARVGTLARADYGRFNVRVFGNSQDTDITIQSDSPYPVLITKMEYIGDFVPQRTNPVK